MRPLPWLMAGLLIGLSVFPVMAHEVPCVPDGDTMPVVLDNRTGVPWCSELSDTEWRDPTMRCTFDGCNTCSYTIGVDGMVGCTLMYCGGLELLTPDHLRQEVP